MLLAEPSTDRVIGLAIKVHRQTAPRPAGNPVVTTKRFTNQANVSTNVAIIPGRIKIDPSATPNRHGGRRPVIHDCSCDKAAEAA